MSTDERLLEEREFLLRSIADLDAEREAGDIDDEDYRRLRDDYVARVAPLLRADGTPPATADATPSAAAGAASTPSAPSARSARSASRQPAGGARRWIVVAAVVVAAAGAGWGVARSAGERVDDDALTGSIPAASTDRIARAQRQVARGDVLEAIKTYDDLLADDPENPVALAERGWLLSRVDPSLVDRGLAGIEQAIALDPGYAEAHFYRGMILLQSKHDTAGAAAAFRTALESNPPPDLRDFLRSQLEAAGGNREGGGSAP